MDVITSGIDDSFANKKRTFHAGSTHISRYPDDYEWQQYFTITGRKSFNKLVGSGLINFDELPLKGAKYGFGTSINSINSKMPSLDDDNETKNNTFSNDTSNAVSNIASELTDESKNNAIRDDISNGTSHDRSEDTRSETDDDTSEKDYETSDDDDDDEDICTVDSNGVEIESSDEPVIHVSH